MNKQEKEMALVKLNDEWGRKDLPLKSVATHAVPGEGNPDTDILFIGEAPGKNEDEQGRPFVGAAGKFLDQLIAGIGYKREDVFIANVIKHRPPGNRDPLPEEIEAYRPWLEGQIEIIKAHLIITLGRFSMEFLLGPGFSITKIHGQPKRRNGRVIIPMYHPAAALYRGDLRPVLAADFAKIPKVLKLIREGEAVSEEKKKEEQKSQKSLF
ncbi:MAG: uracil-DNA glycosylase [Candidatus Andersenbacteria bacterium]|nr:uracil-DNA glycosylase [bacterium]MDZ4225529.1 uracil-DNA glycosylase [Candidatus Andersenbacteria bacterium]